MSERIIMTYGVPYSFVPGTKAKANEVNANFIDVLGKIDDSNSRITQLENTKADDADIDGLWVTKYQVIANEISLTGATPVSVDISDYLPNDNNIYEVLVSGTGTSTATSSQVCICFIQSDIITSNVCIFRDVPKTNGTIYLGGNATMPVGTGRKIYIVRNANYHGTATFSAAAYRKVR
jgi:hypothetical protein